MGRVTFVRLGCQLSNIPCPVAGLQIQGEPSYAPSHPLSHPHPKTDHSRNAIVGIVPCTACETIMNAKQKGNKCSRTVLGCMMEGARTETHIYVHVRVYID